MKQQIIALVGLPGSGKAEVAKYLQKKGFFYTSLSDVLRNVILSLGKTTDRKSMEDIGDILRESLGTDVLARGAKLQIDKFREQNIIIDGIRNPGEIDFLRREVGIFVIGIEITQKRLFELIKKRGRPGDPEDFDAFQKMVKRELGEGEKESGLQLKLCLEMADIVVGNEGTLDELYRKIEEALNSLK